MKKSLFLILFVSLMMLTACKDNTDSPQKIELKSQTLEEFYTEENIENIDKILIRDGSTGASKTVTEQKQIDEFITLIKDIIFTPQDNQEKRYGWSYEITLYDGDKQFLFYLNHFNGVYYDSNPDIYPIVDTFYKQLDSVEE